MSLCGCFHGNRAGYRGESIPEGADKIIVLPEEQYETQVTRFQAAAFGFIALFTEAMNRGCVKLGLNRTDVDSKRSKITFFLWEEL